MTQIKYTLIKAYLDVVLWTRTEGGNMEGVDESTELWRNLFFVSFFLPRFRTGERERGREREKLMQRRIFCVNYDR